MEWTKLETENLPPLIRYGHTGCVYNKKLYLFGGKAKMEKYTLLCDLEIFNLQEKSWSSPLVNTKTTLQLRRNHIAEIIGHHMIVHGGVSENGEYLNDTFLLSLNGSLKWTTCIINDDTPGPTLAGHSHCLVLPHDFKYNPRMHIYKYPELGVGRLQNSRVFIKLNSIVDKGKRMVCFWREVS
jgi:hypothetical protein